VKLRYTLPALAELDAILDDIAAHSPQGARRIQARIRTLTDLLLLHSHIAPHERSGHPSDDDDALSLSGFLRDRGDRNHHSCGPACGA
jgi:plasmid stabilization system protein ParE